MKTHDYEKFAKEYANLEIKDSFYLAYRDIPELIKRHAKGKKALDFGCGGGRSTRFLKKLGFEVIGVDISEDMIQQAKIRDLTGEYLQIKNAGLPFESSRFDLIFVSIVFMEIESKEKMIKILKEMKRVLKKDGFIVVITGTAESYTDNWASFICDFPENKNLKSGDKAKLIVRGTEIVLYDYVWFEEDYSEVFEVAGLKLVEALKPLPQGDEPYKWYAEKRKPHWMIYALKK